jgi:multiple sugar transport system substrate-binding protein
VKLKKSFVIVGAVWALLLFAAGNGQASPYAKYAGTTLVINFPNIAYYEYAIKVIPEFTKETGIKVEIDKMEYMKMRDKQLLECSKPKGDYDLISYVIMWKTEYVSKGLLTPLAPFFANPALASFHPETLIF